MFEAEKNTENGADRGDLEKPRLESLISGCRVVDAVYRGGEGRMLSNLAPSPFVLDGVTLASVEGFIQGIKFPFGDRNREVVFGLHGLPAKRASQEISKEIARQYSLGAIPRIYWNHVEIEFRSSAHRELLGRAIREKYLQHEPSRTALLSTGDALLVHSIPDAPHTSLPAAEFVELLTKIRTELIGSSV